MPLSPPTLTKAHQSSDQTSASLPQHATVSITASTATLGAQVLSPLTRIQLDDVTRSKVIEPVKRITSEADCVRWIQSNAYSTYVLFLQRVCEACVGKPTRSVASDSSSVGKLASLLHHLDSWTDEIQPRSTPQRFGNLAFRDWGARLETQVDELHRTLLPPSLHAFIPELRSYLLDSFGNFTRIDYGSGHEFAFFAWLGYLYRLHFFDQESGLTNRSVDETEVPTQAEEAIGIQLFPLYLRVVWRLQDRYGLEPAGSHGVWGLDDFQFLPYVIGAAQLRQQSTLRPRESVSICSSSSTLASLASNGPEELIYSTSMILPAASLYGKGSDVVMPNVYVSSLLRIGTLKRGPFHEHSPLLHDISTSVPNWIKVYTGMVKMYQAECLNKKVVVQHFTFGGVGWLWNDSASQVPKTTSTMEKDKNWSENTPHGAALALGGASGNLGSMGIPTTRVMGRDTFMKPSPAATRAPLSNGAIHQTSGSGATMLPPTNLPPLGARKAKNTLSTGGLPSTTAPWAAQRQNNNPP